VDPRLREVIARYPMRVNTDLSVDPLEGKPVRHNPNREQRSAGGIARSPPAM